MKPRLKKGLLLPKIESCSPLAPIEGPIKTIDEENLNLKLSRGLIGGGDQYYPHLLLTTH